MATAALRITNARSWRRWSSSSTRPSSWSKTSKAPTSASRTESNVVTVSLQIAEDEIEDTVVGFDAAIEYANEQFEQNEMAQIRALIEQDAAKARTAAEHQARRDERMAKLAKPDLEIRRRRVQGPPAVLPEGDPPEDDHSAS